MSKRLFTRLHSITFLKTVFYKHHLPLPLFLYLYIIIPMLFLLLLLPLLFTFFLSATASPYITFLPDLSFICVILGVILSQIS